MKISFQQREHIDFEKLGHETMLQCGDNEERAKNICGQYIYAYEDQLQPELGRLQSEIEQNKNRGAALHSHLYDRPEPVNDAAMVAYSKKHRILFALAVLAAVACFAGNAMTFYLFGVGLLVTFFLATVATGLPLIVGHPAYEHIVARHKKLQVAIIAVAVILAFAGLLRLAEARQLMVDRATAATPTASPNVDGSATEDPVEQDPTTRESTEAKVRNTLGGAMLLIMIAADLMLGFFVGILGKMYTDEDYSAWRRLHEITKSITEREETMSELHASVEIAKKRCTAGILRAQTLLKRRRPPYHGLLAVALLILLSVSMARAQTIERYEGILIDTSGSISRNGVTNELFRQYLVSTKKLLITETPSTRVWVSSIAVDSFGGDGTLLKGWTPESRGVFTDDLNRARRELASAFAQKSSRLSPVANGTDIFGALWHFNALFDSAGSSAKGLPKTIWIFSDMMNETNSFQMPTLLPLGPEQMLERAKANGLIVPMNGYKVYVYGATPNGLSPQAWHTVKNFWTLYFHSAGAELVTYSPECEVQR